MRIIVLILLFACFNLELAGQEEPKTFSWDCDTLIDYPCFSMIAWQYLTDKQKENFVKFKNKILQNDNISQGMANIIINSRVTVLGLCSTNSVDKKFMQLLDERELSNSLKLVFREYCSCSFKNGKVVSIDEEIKNYYWLYEEYFCAYARDVANNASMKFGPFKDQSIRLENRSIELCEDYRKGEISKHDAYYRLHQEVTMFNDDVWPEYKDWAIDQLLKIDFSSLFKK